VLVVYRDGVLFHTVLEKDREKEKVHNTTEHPLIDPNFESKVVPDFPMELQETSPAFTQQPMACGMPQRGRTQWYDLCDEEDEDTLEREARSDASCARPPLVD